MLGGSIALPALFRSFLTFLGPCTQRDEKQGMNGIGSKNARRLRGAMGTFPFPPSSQSPLLPHLWGEKAEKKKEEINAWKTCITLCTTNNKGSGKKKGAKAMAEDGRGVHIQLPTYL